MSRRAWLALAAMRGAPVAAPAGTFLQFWRAHLDWDEAEWRQLFGYLEALRLCEVIVQWTRYDGIDYRPLAERVLRWAEEARVEVWLGLAHESKWWQATELETIAERDVAWAKELPRGRAWRGWYLPEEIEERRWGGRGAELRVHWRGVRKALRPLAVSGFWGGQMGPEELGRWWRAAARGAVDRVLFQDGWGAGPMTEERWPAYVHELRRGLGRRLTVVVELFERAPGGGAFRAEAADWARVRRQMEVAGRNSVAFSVPEYATPMGGEGAARLYEQWIDFLSSPSSLSR